MKSGIRCTVALVLFFLLSGVTSCFMETAAPSFDINSVQSYRDIPGVTEQEIAAIEALKAAHTSFSYGNVRSTEAFILPDGTYDGFASMFCELLSGLFGIPFVQEFTSRDSLINSISDQTIDFTGELTMTPERMRHYFMTHPIASRPLNIFTYGDAIKVRQEGDLDNLRVAFLETAVTAQQILNMYPHTNFQIVYVQNTHQAIEDLKAGRIDVFVDESTAAFDFMDNQSSDNHSAGSQLFHSMVFFPLVYSPVSLTTANPALAPIISVMDKYLAAGGVDRIYELYREGRDRYARFAFNHSLTDEERAYLDLLAASETGVPVALEYDNYPISFYCDRQGQFTGAAIDILERISLMTGLRFDVITSRGTPWADILAKLSTGEAALVSELRYSEARKDNFLWADKPYAVSHYILMSKAGLPDMEVYQTAGATVGITKGTVYNDHFDRWFSGSPNVRYYDTHEAALNALERGEVDLLMESEFGLLAQANLREKPGYKANIVFISPVSESFFGFNKNEEILRSVISKAQTQINTDRIVRDWTTRVYDYTRTLANQRLLYLSVLAGILLFMSISLVALLMKNNRTKKLYKNQMGVLSAIYKSLPDLVYSKDIDGKYTSCNHAFEKFVGRTEPEILGKTSSEIYEHDQKMVSEILETDANTINSATTTKVERWLTLEDLSQRLYEATYVPLVQDSRVTGLLGISRDITEHKALVEELSKAHKRAELMLDTIPLCCFMLDKEFNCFVCNTEAVRLFKLTDKQEFRSRFYELSPKYQDDGKPSFKEGKTYVQRAFDKGECAFEWTHQLLNGVPIPALVTLVRVNYEDDYAVLAYVRDMREHKQMMMEIGRQKDLLDTVNLVSSVLLDVNIGNFENSLLQAMEMLAKAVYADRVCIWENHIKDDQLYCAKLYEWSEGINPQQSSMPAPDISYNGELPEWEESLSHGNCINALIRDIPPVNRERFFDQGILSTLVVPVFLFNNFWGIVRFDDCRTERKFTENEELILRSASRMIANALIRNEIVENFRATASQLETVVSNYPGIIWSVNQDATITLFNGMYVNKLGQTPMLEGMKYYDAHFGSLHAETVEHIQKTFTGGAQDWISKTDNEVFHLRTMPIYNENGDVTNVVGSLDDITEIIRLQENLEAAVNESREANRAKSSFLAKMSHEIRTPMNAIVGMAELALRENMANIAREHIITVKQAGANLLSIINDFLDFSKIETGKMEIVPSDYFFSSLINDVISIIRMRLIDSQIRFAVNLDCKIPNSLYGDEIRIRQVLLNILNNAVKYTEKGFVSLSAYGEIIDEHTVNITMKIKDSGKGIRQEDMGKLFAEYVQLDQEKNKGVEGTGLGLTIAKGITNAMKGTISVESEYGKGSTFTVKLPQKIISPKPLASVKNLDEKSVLVYERREIYADSIIYGITNLGVNSTLVSSDSELQEKMRKQGFGYIFISFSLFNRNKETILKFGANAKIVVLAEFGEEIVDKKLNVLAMPVHAISIANILNGILHNFSYGDGNEHIVRFTAPDTKVLVVDDINTNLKVAEGLLLPYKMQVDLRKSGIEAIEAMKRTHYDLVFMDHKMPGMDGIETTLQIRAMGIKEPYFNDVPIIALTANAVSGTEEMFLQNGFDDFLSKPIDTIKLNTTLEKWVPKANQKSITGESNKLTEPKTQEANSRVEIDGVDVKKGILISGGIFEFYMDTLALFYKDGIEKIDEIKKCLETGNLHLYTIHVHALKSAAANIGADKLSEAAKALEMAGTRNDADFIETHGNLFLAELETLLTRIDDALLSHSKNTKAKAEPLDVQQFTSELIKLKAAINDLDAGTINETIEGLRELTHGEAVESIIVDMFDDILIAEYDRAIASIDSLLLEETNAAN